MVRRADAPRGRRGERVPSRHTEQQAAMHACTRHEEAEPCRELGVGKGPVGERRGGLASNAGPVGRLLRACRAGGHDRAEVLVGGDDAERGVGAEREESR